MEVGERPLCLGTPFFCSIVAGESIPPPHHTTAAAATAAVHRSFEQYLCKSTISYCIAAYCIAMQV